VISQGAAAGTVTEYIRVFGSEMGEYNPDNYYYFKTFTDDLLEWDCGTTPSGGEKHCYSFDGGPEEIWQTRVQIYPTDGIQYGYNNWWYWEQEDGDWVWEGGLQKYVATGSFIDDVPLEGYWKYRDGHHTYRGEVEGAGYAHDGWVWCPNMYHESAVLYYPMYYPLMATEYTYPNYPNKYFQRYFYARRS
jgi:hypothetical protein